MDEFMEQGDARQVIKNKLRQYYDGRIVRKDLTKSIREGANDSGLRTGISSRTVL